MYIYIHKRYRGSLGLGSLLILRALLVCRLLILFRVQESGFLWVHNPV